MSASKEFTNSKDSLFFNAHSQQIYLVQIIEMLILGSIYKTNNLSTHSEKCNWIHMNAHAWSYKRTLGECICTGVPAPSNY